MARVFGPMNVLLSDPILRFLVFMILVLLCLAVFFAVFTFFLRLRNEREARRWAGLQKSWEPALLEMLANPDSVGSLWERVGDGDHFDFLEFVLQYAQRLGGAERDALQRAAAPYLPDLLRHLSDFKTFRLTLLAGRASTLYVTAFLAVAFSLGIVFSISAVCLEELAFRRYPRNMDLVLLLLLGVVENFGYRQVSTFWRLRGTLSGLFGKTGWGVMSRKGFDSA